ncbi:hypothetical protein BDV3_004094 [Batrachochytrium dendrobatidis]
MQLFVPPWVTHRTGKSRKTPIYSLHVHPSGQKLATAGLVNIKIWNMKPIVSQEAELDPSVPKQLSSMSIHDGAILCVRWSPRGEYLASGSEDAKVVIWKLDGSKIRNTGFGESGTIKNCESYRVVKILPAHESDVADLAWSHDQAFLASCGFDRRVVIWDGVTFEQVKRIDCHAGFVKGITWDPAGKYVATQSDDRSIKVFRTSDWEVETTITEPLESGASTTFFTRLSWGPDGTVIAATNGESGSVCVAPLIQRQDWKSEDFFVGHKAAVEVASFNPRLFSQPSSEPVVGDTVAPVPYISICATGSQDNGISIWSTNHSSAIANILELVEHSVLDLSWTLDGYGLLGCSYDGTVVYLEFNLAEFGRSLNANETDFVLGRYGKRRAKHVIPESTTQLDLEAQLESLEHTVTEAPTPVGRIADLMAGAHQGFPNTSGSTAAVDVNDSTPQMALAESISSTQAMSLGDSQPPASSTLLAQTISRTKDGKKRIQPIFIQSSDDTVPNPFSAPTTVVESVRVPEKKRPEHHIANGVPTSTQVSAAPISNGGIPIVSSAALLIPNSLAHSQQSGVIPTKYVLPMVHGFEALPQLGIPEPRDVFIAESKEGPANQHIGLECRNEKKLARLVCTRGEDQLWHLVLPSPVILACVTSEFVAAACANATLNIFSISGRRSFPAIAMASCAVYLSAQGPFLLCIDGTGQMHIWNIPTQTQLLTHISIAPLIFDEADGETDVDVTLVHISFKSDGLPIITTSRGVSFTYHIGMRAWMKLVDVTTDTYLNRFNGSGLMPRQRRFASMDMLEDRLASAVACGDAEAYRYWLKMYAHKLVEESAVSKAREVCDDLSGLGGSSWDPLILGLPKVELFKEIAPILAQNRSFQRIVTAAQTPVENYAIKLSNPQDESASAMEF